MKKNTTIIASIMLFCIIVLFISMYSVNDKEVKKAAAVEAFGCAIITTAINLSDMDKMKAGDEAVAKQVGEDMARLAHEMTKFITDVVEMSHTLQEHTTHLKCKEKIRIYIKVLCISGFFIQRHLMIQFALTIEIWVNMYEHIFYFYM